MPMNNVEKVLEVAAAEVGYLEKSKTAYKKDPSVLYRKTDGAGKDNYTKYGKDLHETYPQVMDFPAPWCDQYVDWCFLKAYGVSNAKKLLAGNFDDYTVNSAKLYQSKGALDSIPSKGAQVFFTKNGKPSGCYHTGLVYKVEGGYFYTFEGNTSSSTGVVANGGAVTKKVYRLSDYKGKVLFGHPKYDKKYDTVEEVAQAVLRGEYGNGAERRAKLTDEGWNYAIVQSRVSEIIKSRQNKIDDIPKYVWDFLIARIKNPYGVAGLMGNIKDESGFNPKNLQNSYEKKLGMNDEIYTKSVDNGSYKNFCDDLAGFGLCQWTSQGRKTLLYNSRNGRSIGDVDLQLEVLWKELQTSYKGVLNGLLVADNVREASDLVLKKFERPKDQSENVQIRRANYGKQYYDKYS